MENLDNYFLNVNWKDLKGNDQIVGFFSLYNKKFYFVIRSQEKIPRIYEQGFGGRPGIIADKIYSSTEVFDTINKILGLKETEKEKIEIMKDLLVSKIEGDSALKNNRDRISFCEMTESQVEKCKEEIDKMEQSANKKNDEGK